MFYEENKNTKIINYNYVITFLDYLNDVRFETIKELIRDYNKNKTIEKLEKTI